MKQAIVDRNSSVSSAALVSSLSLSKTGASEVVKRWVNEVQESVTSDNVMVQYHALGLLYHIRYYFLSLETIFFNFEMTIHDFATLLYLNNTFYRS